MLNLNPQNKLKNFNEIILIIVSFMILIFSRNFSLIKVGSIPGYITDLILLLLIFFQIINIAYWKNFILRKYKTIIYLIIFFSYYLLTSSSSDIDLIGKDLVLLIYPIIIFLLLYSSEKKMNINTINISPFIFIYSCFLISDFLFDRLPFIESFMWVDLSMLNLPWVNILKMKIPETTLFLILLVFIKLNQNNTISPIFILPGIYIGFAIYESRTVFLSLLFFLLFNFLHFKSKKTIIFILYLFIGFLISLTLNYKNVENIKQSLDNYPEISISSEFEEVGFSRLRLNNFSCISGSFLSDKVGINCEVRFEGSYVNPLPLLNEVEESFNNNLFSTQIEANYKESFMGELSKINTKFETQEDYFKYLNICSNYSNSSLFNSKFPDCDNDVLTITKNLITVSESIFKEVCPSNVTWRINLWKGMMNDLLVNNKIYLGYGVGFSIPQKLVDDKAIEYLCYSESLNNENPLRSGHNTFLTLIYRFGIINFLIFSFLFYKLIQNYNLKNNISLMVFVFIMSIFDPLLETTVTAVPFWYFIFTCFKEKEK